MWRAALLAVLAGVAGGAVAAEPDAETKVKIVEYMLKTPLNEAKPAVVDPFLEIDPETLPKKLRVKARAKQLELKTLLKLHETKKKGTVLPSVGTCAPESYVKPTSQISSYQMAGYEEIQEEESDAVQKRTLCTEEDLACQFSLMIFVDKGSKKPRRLFLSGNDPIMALVAAARTKVQGGNYFGTGFSCMK